MASKPIGIRIPDEINERFEDYGRANFPKGDSFDKTRTILALISKGLGLNADSQTEVRQPLDVKQLVEQEVREAIESLKAEIQPALDVYAELAGK